ncbi:MAG: chorismate-binding protein, partial [Bacteroidota bacterium]
PADFSLNAFFKKIENAYPKAMVYLANLPGIGLWAGASPEILLKYNNGIAETVALAGTQRVVEGQNVRNLEWGKKEIEEHQMVADYIAKKILSNGLVLIDQSEIYTSGAGAVAHLKQRFSFEIAKDQLSDFIKNLRPTPAVCGLPKEKALDLIYQTESYDRQYYCGYLGMVEPDDSVNFYVNLRCMKIYKNHASLFVGGGITKDSIPEKEWEETELKAKTMLNILDLIEV